MVICHQCWRWTLKKIGKKRSRYKIWLSSLCVTKVIKGLKVTSLKLAKFKLNLFNLHSNIFSFVSGQISVYYFQGRGPKENLPIPSASISHLNISISHLNIIFSHFNIFSFCHISPFTLSPFYYLSKSYHGLYWHPRNNE